MTWSEEISRSLFALWRILRFDPDGPSYFNLTVDGFWRSFAVPIVLIPILGVLILPILGLAPEEIERPAGLAFLVAATLSGYLFLVLFPLAMIAITRLLGVSENYSIYIISWNWTIVVPFLFILPISAMTFVGLLTPGFIGFLQIVLLCFLVFFKVTVTKACLQIHGFAAIGIVVLDIVAGELVDYVFQSLI